MNHIVLGLGYGDEGKGMVTAFNADAVKSSSIVIRFSGGHQAGHTIELKNGTRHVFSHFGSGTLSGIPTFWSKYCTFYPTGLWNEYLKLKNLNYFITPKLFVDPLCSMTTFYDLFFNRALEICRGGNKHGSVGVGVGHTFERNETPYKLFAQDIYFEDVLRIKLNSIRDYYAIKINNTGNKELKEEFFKNDFALAEDVFLKTSNRVKELIEFKGESVLSNYPNLIFEGSQGILLDQDYGFFPNVTRSYTTSRNAIEILKRNNRFEEGFTVNYVTRCYSTRHGAGPMPGEGVIDHLIEIKDDTNIPNDWQGTLRIGCLDLDMLKYAISCDMHYSGACNKILTITCMDHLRETNRISVRFGESIRKYSVYDICEELGFSNIQISNSPHYSKLNYPQVIEL